MGSCWQWWWWCSISLNGEWKMESVVCIEHLIPRKRVENVTLCHLVVAQGHQNTRKFWVQKQEEKMHTLRASKHGKHRWYNEKWLIWWRWAVMDCNGLTKCFASNSKEEGPNLLDIPLTRKKLITSPMFIYIYLKGIWRDETLLVEYVLALICIWLSSTIALMEGTLPLCMNLYH